MIPIKQTRIHHPGCNCLQASIASVLELPIDAVPDFNNVPSKDSPWLSRLDSWLHTKYLGVGLAYCDLESGKGLTVMLSGYFILGLRYCPIGAKPEEIRATGYHVVVAYPCNGRFAIAHDPWPVTRTENSQVNYVFGLWIVRNNTQLPTQEQAHGNRVLRSGIGSATNRVGPQQQQPAS